MTKMGHQCSTPQEHMELHYKRHKSFDCANQMTAAGPESEINALIELVKSDSSVFSFSKVKPVPEQVKVFNPLNIKPSFLEEFNALDSYTWREENWATTREASNAQLEVVSVSSETLKEVASKKDLTIEKIAAYKFDTSISPPSGIYHELSKRFPNVVFHYTFDVYSEEEKTSGWAIGKAGKIFNRRQYPDSFRDIKIHLTNFSEQWFELDPDEDEDN